MAAFIITGRAIFEFGEYVDLDRAVFSTKEEVVAVGVEICLLETPRHAPDIDARPRITAHRPLRHGRGRERRQKSKYR